MAVKVLIVDDDEASAKTLMWALSPAGFEVKIALDGLAAIEILNAYIPQVFLVDINMSYLNGYDLYKTLRADARLKEALFIAQTGWNAQSPKNLSKEVGFHHHLVKPIDILQLTALIREAFGP